MVEERLIETKDEFQQIMELIERGEKIGRAHV